MFSTISAAPAKQSVSDTITILSGRLGSATLLEDRRAAILGLRSFAKDFPASVASGALRSFIGSLSKDGEDVDTVKIVLETLLMLFSPSQDSPEASDELVLWLADEFTQHQDNMTLLVTFVDSSEFYSRLYALELLAAILTARPQRTEECLLAAPLAISRLVAALDDQRDAIRSQALGLLIVLSMDSLEIQKLVAFENAFDRIFTLIQAEGSLSDGGRTVEDCLILLANLLRHNASNQSLFRESDCVARLSLLLTALLDSKTADDVAEWAQAQRDRNLYAFLAVVRLFLSAGAEGVSRNQEAFWKHGLAHQVLRLAFDGEAGSVPVRAEALIACGDMIRNAPTFQEAFAQLDVASLAPDTDRVYAIDGLLDVMLNTRHLAMFDLRFAACQCIIAYMSNHAEVRLHFLSRAIEGYRQGTDDSANVLTVLLRPSGGVVAADPYRQWFAAVTSFHLLYDYAAAKSNALALTEGDEVKGEEVVTAIQTIAAHLIHGIGRGDDIRCLVGYLMLLCGWLFEDLDAVNDFLAEGSNVQSLVQVVSQPLSSQSELLQGLSAMLLGITYEFSTKDSPVSRKMLHSILTSRIGRDIYLDRLSRLRRHPYMRDFEVKPQKLSTASANGLPDVFFDADFVGFFKDNYGQIARAIDREPSFEIPVVKDGVQRGVSRELVDSLRAEVKDKDEALADAKAHAITLEGQLGQQQADWRRSNEKNSQETAKLNEAYKLAEKKHEEQLRLLQREWSAKEAELEKRLVDMGAEAVAREAAHQADLASKQQSALAEAERIQLRSEAEVADLRATISRLEADVMKTNKSKTDALTAMQLEKTNMLADEASRTRAAEELARKATAELEAATSTIKELENKINEAESARAEATQAMEATQTELDDLLMVFGDLEEKAAKYKARLCELGDKEALESDD
ncbi:hypothetical protein CDD82_6280 [Ophiocordyceps australis]|uniref:Vesicle tethering protein Uso1/P115-like head domain-containing protein n=1 Tax=Ophiocordyceps australis TaxID=1399860 RepID=A0A2C5YVX4_9HYPO|nr:hypothetical protein CDD82_6280 [Ophiocordyceps australis]